jgi:hypothetical protein
MDDGTGVRGMDRCAPRANLEAGPLTWESHVGPSRSAIIDGMSVSPSRIPGLKSSLPCRAYISLSEGQQIVTHKASRARLVSHASPHSGLQDGLGHGGFPSD